MGGISYYKYEFATNESMLEKALRELSYADVKEFEEGYGEHTLLYITQMSDESKVVWYVKVYEGCFVGFEEYMESLVEILECNISRVVRGWCVSADEIENQDGLERSDYSNDDWEVLFSEKGNRKIVKKVSVNALEHGVLGVDEEMSGSDDEKMLEEVQAKSIEHDVVDEFVISDLKRNTNYNLRPRKNVNYKEVEIEEMEKIEIEEVYIFIDEKTVINDICEMGRGKGKIRDINVIMKCMKLGKILIDCWGASSTMTMAQQMRFKKEYIEKIHEFLLDGKINGNKIVYSMEARLNQIQRKKTLMGYKESLKL